HGVVGWVEAHLIKAAPAAIERHQLGREAIGQPAILQCLGGANGGGKAREVARMSRRGARHGRPKRRVLVPEGEAVAGCRLVMDLMRGTFGSGQQGHWRLLGQIRNADRATVKRSSSPGLMDPNWLALRRNRANIGVAFLPRGPA